MTVVMFSGGIASWATAWRWRQYNPGQPLTLLFADTLIEDDDLYRFLPQAAASVDGELVTISDGRTPWEVFRDVRFIGNTRADPCSRILKRDLMRSWLAENCEPTHTTVLMGFDWTEEHRFKRAGKYWEPWRVECPLLEPPLLQRHEWVKVLEEIGIRPPRLYRLGFPHNNCGGFCIKAGHAQFRLLYEALPERFAEHERQEQALREHLGKPHAILRDRRGGEVKPFTLRQLRHRIETEGLDDQLRFDFGGCACMEPPDDENRP